MYRKKPKFPVISLFSGAGGLDLGFRRAGFEVPLAVDVSPAACATLNASGGSGVALVADLRTTSASALMGELARRNLSVLPRGVIGGPPCQGFSRGNARRDARDPRNRLPFTYAKLLGELERELAIDFFVFENVVGLTENKGRFTRLRRAFRDAGFRLFIEELDAQNFGVPQVRRRLFVVGLNARKFPNTEFSFPRGRRRRKTVRDVLDGIPAPVYFTRGMKQAEVPYHPNHWTSFPKSLRFQEQRFNRWRSFRQISWDEPSPTVAYGNREIHIHPSGTRRLSVYEAMLLQGFPADYVIRGNFSEQVTQVSNAVPPAMGFALAERIYELLSAS